MSVLFFVVFVFVGLGFGLPYESKKTISPMNEHAVLVVVGVVVVAARSRRSGQPNCYLLVFVFILLDLSLCVRICLLLSFVNVCLSLSFLLPRLSKKPWASTQLLPVVLDPRKTVKSGVGSWIAVVRLTKLFEKCSCVRPQFTLAT